MRRFFTFLNSSGFKASLTVIVSMLVPIFASAYDNVFSYSYDDTDQTATVTGMTGSTPNIEIPASVEYNGKTYKVVAIGDRAFWKFENSQSFGDYGYKFDVTLPNTIETIGKWAFGYTTINKINIPASVTSIGEEAFLETPVPNGIYCAGYTAPRRNGTSATLGLTIATTVYVPYDCKSAYNSSPSAFAGCSIQEASDPKLGVSRPEFTLNEKYSNDKEFEVVYGKTSYMRLALAQAGSYRSFSFDLELPDGLSVSDLNGLTVSSIYSNGHTATCTKNANGTYHVECSSSTNSLFSDNASADIISIPLTPSENFCRGTIKLTNANPNSRDKEFTATVRQYLRIDPNSLTLPLGSNSQLTAYSVDEYGAIDVTSSVTWSSSNTTVASLMTSATSPGSYTGRVSGQKIGTATITAQYSGMTAECSVEVVPVMPTEIKFANGESSLTLGEGQVYTMTTPTILPSNTTDKTIAWRSSDETIATVNAGVITAIKKGSTTIIASCGSVSAECNLTVTDKIIAESISFDWNDTEIWMEVQDTYKYKALTIRPDNTTDKTINWKSSDEQVATVYNGVVTATGIGKATITATCGNASATSVVTVYKAKIGDLYYKFDSQKKEASVTYDNYYNGGDKNNYWGLSSIEIPESVEYNGQLYDVTSIGKSAFSGCATLTSIRIPESVKVIEEDAFWYSEKLLSVTLPESLEVIGSRAFSVCTGLQNIDIPNSVTTIGNAAFIACENLSTIELPESLTSLGESVFNGCGLTSIKLPKSITVIPKGLLSGCKNLESINIPSNITSVGIAAFCESGLTAISLPNSVTSIGEGAFMYCESLESAIMPNVTSVGFNTFYHCRLLKSVSMPNVIAIDEGAFESCGLLESVSLPQVTSVGLGAFLYCNSLKSVSMPKVTSIDQGAFNNCISLESVSMPNVKSIEAGAFYACRSLRSIIIPVSITSIKSRVFYDCSSLESIEIPSSVTEIEESAFYGCTSLENIKIPNSVTLIGNAVFYGCTNLRTVHLPGTLTSMGDYGVFQGCNNLTDVYYLAKSPIIADGAGFSGSLTKLHVLPGVKDYIVQNAISPWSNFKTDEFDNIVEISYGDFDLDGTVLIDDAIKVANYAVGNEISGDFIEELADVNGDDSVTISDAVGTVSVVLNQSTSTSMAKVSGMSDAEITDFLVAEDPIANGGNMSRMEVSLDSSVGYVALQADVYVPEGMKLESVTNGNRAVSHTVMHREVGENIYRVVVFNFDGVEFDDAPGSLFTLNFSSEGAESGDIQLINIHASDAKGKGYRLGVQNGSTGVGSLNGDKVSIVTEGGQILINGAEGRNVAVYTTDGRLVGRNTADNESIAVPAGIYIVSIDGKTSKIVVK